MLPAIGGPTRVPRPLNHDNYQFTTLAEMFAREVGMLRRANMSRGRKSCPPCLQVWQQGPIDRIGALGGQLNAMGLLRRRTASGCSFPNARRTSLTRRRRRGGTLTDSSFSPIGRRKRSRRLQRRVFVANGQVFVYAPDGRQIGRIDVPERPTQVVSGARGPHAPFDPPQPLRNRALRRAVRLCRRCSVPPLS